MSASSALRVGILGLGTVGTGVARILTTHRELLAARAGRPIVLAAAADRDLARDRGLDLSGVQLFDDARALIEEADVDVIVELIGGKELARSLVLEAIARKRHLVTANKALIAEHGEEVFAAARKHGVQVLFEAAVAGGIPILKALREGLAANEILAIYGILNGTCNYILSRMEQEGLNFSTALAEAQRLGYAEADPSLDVGGVDAAHKLAILAAMAFGARIDFSGVFVEGIEQIAPIDIEYARELGYRIRLLAIARPHREGIEMRVHPALVPAGEPMAEVRDSYNAVLIVGDFVERTMFYGRGAGERPTASAVVADLIDLARGIAAAPTMSYVEKMRRPRPAVPIVDVECEYYLRLMVQDRPGAIAAITSILGDHRISLEALLQRERHATRAVPVVMLTHATREGNLQAAVARIAALDAVAEPPVVLRVERFSG